MQLWYCLRIAGKLLGEIGVDIYRQFVVRGAVYGCSRHHQFPQTILLRDCEGILIVEDVLGGRDDLGGCLLLLFALSLLAEEVSFNLNRVFIQPLLHCISDAVFNHLTLDDFTVASPGGTAEPRGRISVFIRYRPLHNCTALSADKNTCKGILELAVGIDRGMVAFLLCGLYQLPLFLRNDRFVHPIV